MADLFASKRLEKKEDVCWRWKGKRGSLPGLQWFQPQASSILCQDQATGNAIQIG